VTTNAVMELKYKSSDMLAKNQADTLSTKNQEQPKVELNPAETQLFLKLISQNGLPLLEVVLTNVKLCEKNEELVFEVDLEILKLLCRLVVFLDIDRLGVQFIMLIIVDVVIVVKKMQTVY
jgi:hypothetical protein